MQTLVTYRVLGLKALVCDTAICAKAEIHSRGCGMLGRWFCIATELGNKVSI